MTRCGTRIRHPTKAAEPDRGYLLGILSNITKVSTLYKDEYSNGKSPVLAQYAQEALLRLRQHHRNAHNLLARAAMIHDNHR
jgi:hypothetical protein